MYVSARGAEPHEIKSQWIVDRKMQSWVSVLAGFPGHMAWHCSAIVHCPTPPRSLHACCSFSTSSRSAPKAAGAQWSRADLAEFCQGHKKLSDTKINPTIHWVLQHNTTETRATRRGRGAGSSDCTRTGAERALAIPCASYPVIGRKGHCLQVIS